MYEIYVRVSTQRCIKPANIWINGHILAKLILFWEMVRGQLWAAIFSCNWLQFPPVPRVEILLVHNNIRAVHYGTSATTNKRHSRKRWSDLPESNKICIIARVVFFWKGHKRQPPFSSSNHSSFSFYTYRGSSCGLWPECGDHRSVTEFFMRRHQVN